VTNRFSTGLKRIITAAEGPTGEISEGLLKRVGNEQPDLAGRQTLWKVAARNELRLQSRRLEANKQAGNRIRVS